MAKVLVFLLFCAFLAANESNVFVSKSLSEVRTTHAVRQAYEESCGAAALATLLNLYGAKKSEKDILLLASKTDMLSFEELGRIARELGYEAAGYQLSKEVFEKSRIPVLALVVREAEFPHFVVAVNHSGDFVEVFDPSFGDYISSKRDFYAMWEFASGGFALIVAPKGYVRKEFEFKAPAGVFFGR